MYTSRAARSTTPLHANMTEGLASSYLLFVPLGLVFYTSLYSLFKHYTVKWLCRKALGTSNITFSPTPTEERGTVEKNQTSTTQHINGFREGTGDIRKSPLTVFDQGDVTEISQL